MGNFQGLLICLTLLIFFAILLVFLKQDRNSHENCKPEIIIENPKSEEKPLPQHHRPNTPSPTPPTCPPDWREEARKIYFQGYDDARLGRRPDYHYRDNYYYHRGYRDGIPFCPPTFRFNFNFD